MDKVMYWVILNFQLIVVKYYSWLVNIILLLVSRVVGK